MADKKLADGEIQEQRRECLCKLTKFVGAAGVAAAVWPLVSALSPDEKTLGENEPIDVSLAGVAAGQTIRRIWQGKLILIHHRTQEEIVAARNTNWHTLIDPQSDSERVSAVHPNGWWFKGIVHMPDVSPTPSREGWAGFVRATARNLIPPGA